MEACASSHHWRCWFAARGHTVRIIPAEFVKPFRPEGKNDAADAQAIAVAALQPTMRFAAIESVEQQAMLAWHSVREGWQQERTALMSRTRGLLAEFGLVIARSADRFVSALQLIEDVRLPDPVRAMLPEVREQLADLNLRLVRCDQQIATHARNSDVARRAGGEVLNNGRPVNDHVNRPGLRFHTTTRFNSRSARGPTMHQRTCLLSSLRICASV